MEMNCSGITLLISSKTEKFVRNSNCAELKSTAHNGGPYKSALIAAPRILLRGAAIENAAIAAAVVVFYCGAAVVVFYCGRLLRPPQ